jgi:hypothetical protein
MLFWVADRPPNYREGDTGHRDVRFVKKKINRDKRIALVQSYLVLGMAVGDQIPNQAETQLYKDHDSENIPPPASISKLL